jgi:hypothetical protein
MRNARAVAVVFGLVAPVALTAACGARSGLLPYGVEPGVFEDAGVDVPVIDDVVLPGLDVQPLDVVRRLACQDASDTLIYTVTEENSILRFDPSSSQFTRIGTLVCPAPPGIDPFSMAVDQQGNAYVLYAEPGGAPGNVFKVNLNTAECTPTSFVPNTLFANFGMAFSANEDAATGETLYVANYDFDDPDASSVLGAINETSLVLTVVGTLTPTVRAPELTGTGDGRLFGFTAVNNPDTPGCAIAQIDPTTAKVIAQSPLPTVTQGNGWAFGFWGGNFYLFTAPDGETSIVQRYNPTDGTVVQVATYPETIVGAGVSTCAPVQ